MAARSAHGRVRGDPEYWRREEERKKEQKIAEFVKAKADAEAKAKAEFKARVDAKAKAQAAAKAEFKAREDAKIEARRKAEAELEEKKRAVAQDIAAFEKELLQQEQDMTTLAQVAKLHAHLVKETHEQVGKYLAEIDNIRALNGVANQDRALKSLYSDYRRIKDYLDGERRALISMTKVHNLRAMRQHAGRGNRGSNDQVDDDDDCDTSEGHALLTNKASKSPTGCLDSWFGGGGH